nr:hypothetical protein [Tanacetum cinerariifolium]
PTVNDEVRVQSLIDEKRINIKESSIRRTLQLDDEEGISCLASDDIFTCLANMGYEKMSDKLTFYKAFFSPQWKFLIHTILQCLSAKTTSWNEFNSTMASTIICLTINQKFNFSRYILLSLIKNIEAGVPFYMFIRFVQLLVDHQLGDTSHHQDIYDNPSVTKKVFANMKRVGTCFSRVITPLFKGLLVQAAEEVGKAQDDVSIPTASSTSKPHKNHKSKKQQPIVPKFPSPAPSPQYTILSPTNDPIPVADKDSLKFQELIDLWTRLSNKVLDLESEVIDLKSSFTHKITKLEEKVHKLEEENRILKETSFKSAKVDTAKPVEDIEESFKQEMMIADMDEDVEVNLQEAQAKAYNLDLQHSEKVLSMHDTDEEEPAEVEEVLKDEAFAKQLEAKLNANINRNDVVEQVKRSEKHNNEVMRYQALKRKPVTEAHARKNMMIYLKNMAGFKMDFFKGMTYSEIRPIFEKHYNFIQAFLKKEEEEVTVQEKRK